MILNLFIEILLNIFEAIITPVLIMVPAIDSVVNFSQLGFVFDSLHSIIGLLSYLAGGSHLIIFPFFLNLALSGVEFGVSLGWWFLHKTHIVGGGH